MYRWMILLVGCGSSLPLPSAPMISHGALLAAVAPDDSLVAVVSSNTASDLRALVGASDGILLLLPPASNAAVDVEVGRVFGFTPTGYLVYGVNRDQSLGGGLFTPMVWKAGWSQPVQLSADPIYEVFFTDGDIIYTGTDPQMGTLSTARLSDCDQGRCRLAALGQANVLRRSSDGARCVYQAVTPDGVDLFYFDYAMSSPVLLAHLSNADVAATDPTQFRLIDLTADGSRLALCAPGGGLQVRSASDLSTVPWASPPPGTVQSMVMHDAATVLFRLGSFLYRSTADEVRQVAAAESFEAITDADQRVVAAFLADGTSAPFSVTAVDFAGSAPVAVAVQTARYPSLSHDHTAAFFFDEVDATGSGLLKALDVSSLFSPSGANIATIGSSGPASATFIPGADDVVYFDHARNDTLYRFRRGNAPIPLVRGATSFIATAASLYFESITSQGAIGTAGIAIYRDTELPP